MKKVIRLDDLYEELTNDSEYCEYISTLMYYDSRSKYIIKSRPYFKLNEEYEVYDEDNKVINIIKNVEGEKIPLKLIVTGIDEDHNLTSFKYNIEQGYTIFGKNGSLTGYIKKDDLSIGEIELISIDRFPRIITLNPLLIFLIFTGPFTVIKVSFSVNVGIPSKFVIE